MRYTFAFVMLACVTSLALAADSPAGAADSPAPASLEQAIKDRAKEFDATWAKHDAHAIAAYYATDGEIVTADGNTLSGRDGIEQGLTDGFNGQLKDCTLTTTVGKVRLITPDVALVDSDAQLKTGDGDPQNLHLVSILVKKDGKWLTATTRVITYKQ